MRNLEKKGILNTKNDFCKRKTYFHLYHGAQLIASSFNSTKRNSELFTKILRFFHRLYPLFFFFHVYIPTIPMETLPIEMHA